MVTVISFISTITLSQLKKAIKVKAKIVRAIPLPPISLKKGPVPICPPNKKVKAFFDKVGTTVEIKDEKSSINFWSTSGMMAPFYQLLSSMTDWLVKRGVKRNNRMAERGRKKAQVGRFVMSEGERRLADDLKLSLIKFFICYSIN